MLNKNTKTPTANVHDGFLIITLTKSVTPVVWRLELEKAKVAAFEIQKHEKKHALSIKVARKAVEIIGSFDDKEDALDALLSISQALQNTPVAHTAQNTNTQPASQPAQVTPPQSSVHKKNNKAVIALIATCFALGLFYYYWARLIPTTQTFETQTISNSTQDPASKTGVPVSADDLLKGF